MQGGKIRETDYITGMYQLLNCNCYKFDSKVNDLDKYLIMLREHGIKVTPQRLEILKYLDARQTTVYNTLETLKDHGMVQALTISENELRYDIIIKQHHHFMCRKCGIIEDIDIECPHFSTTLVGGKKVEEVHGYFKGVCDDCQNLEK